MIGFSEIMDRPISLCGIPVDRNKIVSLEVTLFVVGVISIVGAILLLVSHPALIGTVGNGVIMAIGILETLGAFVLFALSNCRKKEESLEPKMDLVVSERQIISEKEK